MGITTQVQISTLLQIAKRLESDRRECKSKSQTPSWSLKMKPGCEFIENFCRSKEKLLTICTSLSFINERSALSDASIQTPGGKDAALKIKDVKNVSYNKHKLRGYNREEQPQ